MSTRARQRLAVALGAGLVALGVFLIAGLLREDEAAGPDGESSDLGLITEGKLTVGTASPFPPFVIGQPPEISGYEIEVVKAVAEDLGLQPEYQTVPFDRLLADAAAAKFDLVAPASAITLQREQSVDFADPHYEAQLALLVTPDSDVGAVEDLEGKTIAVRAATTGEEYAQEETPATSVLDLPDDAAAINAVRSGKADAAIIDQPVAQAGVDIEVGVEIATVLSTGVLFGLAVADGNDNLREQVNLALRELKDDGTIAELYQRYFSIEPPESVLSATNDPT